VIDDVDGPGVFDTFRVIPDESERFRKKSVKTYISYSI
jgi:hypothetical protein